MYIYTFIRIFIHKGVIFMNIKEAIISIITEKQISTQTELVEELKNRESANDKQLFLVNLRT